MLSKQRERAELSASVVQACFAPLRASAQARKISSELASVRLKLEAIAHGHAIEGFKMEDLTGVEDVAQGQEQQLELMRCVGVCIGCLVPSPS